MRLADFILANVEAILMEWEGFARSIWPPREYVIDPAELRDDAEDILNSTALDMKEPHTLRQRIDRSRGEGHASEASALIDRASVRHGAGRVGSGFELWAVMAEYRAIRASVLRLWRESAPSLHPEDLDDVTRFNESIDQSLTEAVRAFSDQVKRDRDALLANEHSARTDAENANRAKDVFLATLSHEMRTPLTAISGWVTLLRMKNRSGADITEGLDVIERSTKAQVQLIEDVLDVSRIVSGKLRMEMKSCDLGEVVKAGVEVVRPSAEARNITLDVQIDPAASAAMCDATRMQQVVWNLVSNAIKFTPKSGTVRVVLERQRSTLQMSVSDNGQGIGPDLLPYVFDRFKQADSSSRRKFGGLGLGLSIVRHLVEAHGGTISVHSDGEGYGSTFTVRLPIGAVRVEDPDTDGEDLEAGAKAFTLSPTPLRLDGIRVMVVDDESDARRVLTLVLEGVGAKVISARSVEEALSVLSGAVARGERPDVLVSDLGLPERDGYDLIHEVRKIHPAHELPAVALTAFAHKEDARAALLAGFQVHLSKPVNLHDLTAVIASITGRSS